MTVAKVETGEVIVPLTRDEAEMLTAKIAANIDQAWRGLVYAYERQAHKALGFKSWEAYVGERFNISRQHAYRLIDQAFVIREIEAAVGTVYVSPDGDSFGVTVTEAEARDIKLVLTEVIEEIREELEADPEADPEAVVGAAVKRARAKDAGGSNPAPKDGAPVNGTDPPADLSGAAAELDARDQEEHAATRYREDFTKAIAKTYGQLLTLSPERALEDGDREFRRSLSVLGADLRKFANACDAALAKSQRLRSV